MDKAKQAEKVRALVKLQTLQNETTANGYSHPTALSVLSATQKFIVDELEDVIDAWHEREIELETVKHENEQLLKRLALYEKVAV